ncbi:receptor-type tyrosine-protein phosphatase alpha-like [Physella acuta]|uniref:receptor-type tyrosine-protein phosphatase alpha-like n=1 Tax=Physella acuta TaxID=109671 RepID=UPI0027DCDA5D|nr:receptor-type tyrosine-protein phosphatase alpha-like [Physella acuta]
MNGSDGVNCLSNKRYWFDKNNKDIMCDSNGTVDKIVIKFPKKLNICSIYISGGINVAYGQQTNQSSTYDKATSDKAVDGNTDSDFDKGSCTHTDDSLNTPQWWAVTFNRTEYVNRYVLYNRGHNQGRLGSFRLHSGADIQMFTYNDPGTTQDQYTIITLPTQVSYVNISKVIKTSKTEYIILTLCEVEVYAEPVCSSGMHGVMCEKKCNCTNSADTCFPVTGRCKYKCAPGFRGINCNQSCSQSYWGVNCENRCLYCVNGKCDSRTGLCAEGCLGYSDPRKCSKICKINKYGKNCSRNCSTNCLERKCNHTNGICFKCISGFQGDFCNQTCDPGYYGTSCLLQCNKHCTDQLCNQTTGHCFRCHPGYYGDTCELRCSDQCGGDRMCDVNGTCLYGCSDGYHGDKCLDACNEYYHGLNCSERCSSYCGGNGSCDSVTGTCLENCTSGYMGSHCNESCVDGTWGDRCSYNCSRFCKRSLNNTWCDPVNGTCLNGCTENRYGAVCLNEALSYQDKTSALYSILGVVPMIAAVVIIIVIIKWRKSKKAQKTISTKPKELTQTKQITTLEYTSIAASDLCTFINSHTSEYYSDTFVTIPTPKNRSMTVGLGDINKSKNRYKNVCAYDETRVRLSVDKSTDESDYINASFIRTFKLESNIIAAQGPNKSTITDFIRMLWEQEVEKIVMLTNIIEEGKSKCEQYWPDDNQTRFNNFTVKLACTQVFAHYTIRKLKLCKDGEAERSLTQFHYTSWPDKGVPATPWALVDFHQQVELCATTKPVLVHCSAGVGRTGTYIALCNVLQMVADTGMVDFFSTVTKLREDRIMMVQTVEQYEFLHKACLVAMYCRDKTLPLANVSDTSINYNRQEYSELCNIVASVRKSEEDHDQETVYQNCDVSIGLSDLDATTNVIFLSSFTKLDDQIVSQAPQNSNMADFWTLVTQYEVSVIVTFESDMESQPENELASCKYFPVDGADPLNVATYSITTESLKYGQYWETRNLKVHNNNTVQLVNQSTNKELDGFSVTLLKVTNLDLDPLKLLTLLKHIRGLKAGDKGPVMYVYRDDATFCGLLAALSLVLDRLDYHHTLTVPLVVGSVKSLLPTAIPTEEEYEVIYKVIQHYVKCVCLDKVDGDCSTRKDMNCVFSDDHVYANTKVIYTLTS